MQSKILYRCGNSVVVAIVVVVVYVHKNVKVFFCFEDIDLKLIRLIYYGFLRNIVRNFLNY